MMTSREKILAYKTWRQRIRLEDGLYTMGYLNMPNEWEFNYMPDRLDGKSFLDVGSNDGYFPLEAEQRGASRSVATDLYYDGPNGNVGGWNVEGIKLLRLHFQSKIEIASKSIYDLHEFNNKFDVVLCSNVISWLDNINEAIAQLCGICDDTLFIKDGFLTRFDPEPVLQYEKGKGLVAFRANLSYIREVLRVNGFNHIEIKPIFTYQYFDWQTDTFPSVKTDKEIQIFTLPDETKAEGKLNCRNAWKVSEIGNFSFIKNIGWVRTSDIEVAPRSVQSIPGKLLKGMLSENQYTDYIRKKGEENYVKSYMVIAKRG
jgi:SAM-dependent methyltransferase